MNNTPEYMGAERAAHGLLPEHGHIVKVGQEAPGRLGTHRAAAGTTPHP